MITELMFVKYFTMHLILKPCKILSTNINLGHGFVFLFFYKEEKNVIQDRKMSKVFSSS